MKIILNIRYRILKYMSIKTQHFIKLYLNYSFFILKQEYNFTLLANGSKLINIFKITSILDNFS